MPQIDVSLKKLREMVVNFLCDTLKTEQINTQCESFRIFLPHRFYVNSILDPVNMSKLPICAKSRASDNYNSGEFLQFYRFEICQKSKFRALENIKLAVSETPKLFKIDFT